MGKHPVCHLWTALRALPQTAYLPLWAGETLLFALVHGTQLAEGRARKT